MFKKIKNNLAAFASITGHGAPFPPAENTLVEDLFWSWHNLHTRIRHALHPLTKAEQAAAEVELLTGKPAPALDDKKDGEE